MTSTPDSDRTSQTSPGTPRALRASELRYRRLFESAQDGILIVNAHDGRIVEANPFLVAMLGYPHDALIGKQLWQLGFFGDIDASKAAFVELRDKGYIRYSDLPLKTAHGVEISVEFISNVYDVGGARVIQCNIRDITAHKRLENAKRENDRLTRNLVEHLPHRILVKDRDSVVLFCNANFARDLNLPVAEIVGKDGSGYYPPEMLERYKALDREVMASGVTVELEEPRLVDGQQRWIHTLKVPYRDEHGAVVGVLVVFEDITAQKRLQEQSLQSQKLEAVGQLAGGVAHDFNNLLTVILGYCDLTTTRLAPDDPLRADLEQIRLCAERATNLTRQLLVFSRKQVTEVKVIDLNALVSALDQLLQRVIGEHIEMRTRLGPGLGCIRADPGQIELAVMNLVVNARDAMPAGGQLSLETSNVDLDADYASTHLDIQPGHYVMLAVTDTGTGMDAATKAHIFDPYFTTKELGKGTGLGLPAVYGVVKYCGGQILCYSEPGVGTTFKIYLPRIDEEPAAPRAVPLAMPSRGSGTILVAEDDGQVRAIVVRMLGLDGYSVIECRNGTDALREFLAASDRIDLVISDMVMPGMTGLELRAKVQAARPGTKVLLMSGYTGDVALRDGALDAGTMFLQKPFNRESLSQRVRDLLHQERSPPASSPPPPGTPRP